MNKEKYIPVDLEIQSFECSDIVTSSVGFDGEPDEFWA